MVFMKCPYCNQTTVQESQRNSGLPYFWSILFVISSNILWSIYQRHWQYGIHKTQYEHKQNKNTTQISFWQKDEHILLQSNDIKKNSVFFSLYLFIVTQCVSYCVYEMSILNCPYCNQTTVQESLRKQWSCLFFRVFSSLSV